MFHKRNTILAIAALALAAVVVLAPSATRAADPIPVKVFLLAGQSNMAGRAATSGLPTSPVNLQLPQDDVLFYYGSSLTTLRPGSGSDFGPEVTFGRTVADYLPSDNVALIKYGDSGTSLHVDWDPTGSSNTSYDNFRNKVTGGMAAPWPAGLSARDRRHALDAGRTRRQDRPDHRPVPGQPHQLHCGHAARITARTCRSSSAGCRATRRNIPLTQLTEIRTAQENVAASDSLSYMIDTDTFSVKSDYLHFDADGQIALGEAFANSYYATTPEPATLALLAIGSVAAIRRRRRQA